MGEVIPNSARALIFGLPSEPFFVVMMITPFAPRTPYTAEAEASFRIEKEAISSVSTKSSSRSMPSTRTNGVADPLKEDTPRIKNSAALAFPGSPERLMATTPASCPAKTFEIDEPGTLSLVISSVDIAPTTLSFFWFP